MKNFIKVDASSNNIEIGLDVNFFIEGNYVIACCPSLELSGYGKTKKDADESMEIVLEEYFSYTIENKTLIKDLKQLGWTLH